MLSSILVILMLAFIVLVVGLAAAFGVAAIGWLVGRVFGLTQWQGTLVALGTTLGIGFLIYQLGLPPGPVLADPDIAEWNEEPELEETPVVPWRHHRPTPGQVQPDKPSSKNRPAKK